MENILGRGHTFAIILGRWNTLCKSLRARENKVRSRNRRPKKKRKKKQKASITRDE